MQKLDYKDAAIHNYLLSLYAQLQPDKLMVYLNFQGDVRISSLSHELLLNSSNTSQHVGIFVVGA